MADPSIPTLNGNINFLHQSKNFVFYGSSDWRNYDGSTTIVKDFEILVYETLERLFPGHHETSRQVIKS